MELEEAIRSRRTHKVYGAEPVARRTLEELLELARWAPNHHLTEPWRFRVPGQQALERLKAQTDGPGVPRLRAGAKGGAKVDHARSNGPRSGAHGRATR